MRRAMTFAGKNKAFREWLTYAFSFESPFYQDENGIQDMRALTL
jgi:hypothetical protein